MSQLSMDRIHSDPAGSAAIVVAAIGAATILGAYFFQFVLKLVPCPLCYEQRYAYYFAIPLAVMIALGARVGAKRKVIIAALAAIAAMMLWNAGLGAYHSGVEWHLWRGPQDCSGDLSNLRAGGGLLQQLETVRLVRCDEAPWRFLGLSLAGYNVLISLALAVIAACGAWMTWRLRTNKAEH